MTDEDKERLHRLLDYAIDNNEDYVLAQYARMDLDWHLHKETYRLLIKKEYDTTQDQQNDQTP